jgi:hypothetical protein
LKTHITDNAKSLATIIGTEYAQAQRRVELGFIKQDRMLGTLWERLNRVACSNINLRMFLDNIGHIPEEEDESMEYPWAEDPREDRDVEVAGKRGPGSQKGSRKTNFGSRGNRLTSPKRSG